MDLSSYYSSICKTPILTKEKEVALFAEHRSPETSESRRDTIRNEMIQANLRFAFKQAKKFSRNDPSIFEDLISAGNEGLLVGFDKFDSSRDIRYLSYAGWWVTQRILKEMSKMRIVALPIWKQQLASRIAKVKDTNENISLADLLLEFPEIPKKDVAELYQSRYLTFYIEDMDENDFEIDVIEEETQKRIDDERVWKGVSSLPSPHREVIARCYGLEDGEEYSPAKIAKALKVPKEEIKRIKMEGMRMLRQSIC